MMIFLTKYFRSQAALLILFIPAGTVTALPFTADSYLVSSRGNLVWEYTRDGDLIQTIEVPYPGGNRPATENIRDIVLNNDGTLSIFNGTFDPFLSIYEPLTGVFAHSTFPGWSSDGNTRHGAIASYGEYVFVTDNSTFGGLDGAAGILRFNRYTGAVERFGSLKPYDISIGPNNKLYILETDLRTIHVYDSLSLMYERTVSLTQSSRGIAVDEHGEIIGTSNVEGVGGLVRYDPFGTVLEMVGGAVLADIDINGLTGDILAVDNRTIGGDIYWASSDLIGATAFNLSIAQFVAFGPTSVRVTEPATIFLVLSGFLLVLSIKRA